ncbi:MAG: methylenetetrahydrofolate reductase [NAD(P)H] [Candidatus Berkiella sp.]
MALHLSFEYFPPHSKQGLEKLIETSQNLNPFHPEYYSVTFGAGGSTQERTLETCLALLETTKTNISPHISCVGTEKESIRTLLNQYKIHQIKHLVVLRGDLPSGMVAMGDFAYANELVSWIRKEYGDYFHIAIACYPEVHPQSFDAKKDFNYFKAKVEAGADEAITQYFYNPDSYFYFVEHCQKENINIPIVPGIMPITNYNQLARFSSICGAEIPRWIRKHLESISDDPQSIMSFGVDVVTHLCETLIQGGAPGLHFYTLNKSESTVDICNKLKLG